MPSLIVETAAVEAVAVAIGPLVKATEVVKTPTVNVSSKALPPLTGWPPPGLHEWRRGLHPEPSRPQEAAEDPPGGMPRPGVDEFRRRQYGCLHGSLRCVSSNVLLDLKVA